MSPRDLGVEIKSDRNREIPLSAGVYSTEASTTPVRMGCQMGIRGREEYREESTVVPPADGNEKGNRRTCFKGEIGAKRGKLVKEESGSDSGSGTKMGIRVRVTL